MGANIAINRFRRLNRTFRRTRENDQNIPATAFVPRNMPIVIRDHVFISVNKHPAGMPSSEPFGHSNDLQFFLTQAITGNRLQTGTRHRPATQFLHLIQTRGIVLEIIPYPANAFYPVAKFFFTVAAGSKTRKIVKFKGHFPMSSFDHRLN